MTHPEEERPIEFEAPPEENIEPADVAERIHLDPEEQANYPEQDLAEDDSGDS